jgi:hypothetical protein
MTLKESSIADLRETEIIRQVFAAGRSYFSGFHGFPTPAVACVERKLFDAATRVNTDVDILIAAPGRPDQAIAVECKRFKLDADALRVESEQDEPYPKKLAEFPKGVTQANALVERAGFWQVYLWVLVMIDTREQNGGRYTYEGLKSKAQAKVSAAISRAQLDKRVGLVRFDFVQSMDSPFLGLGTIHISLHDHVAVQRSEPQAEWLTRWVEEQMQRPDYRVR